MYTPLKKWFALIAILFWLLNSKLDLLAQQPDLQPTFTGKKGLPSSSINHITRDSEGRIWIATDNGLSIKNTNKKALEILVSKISGSVKQIAFVGGLTYIAVNNKILLVNAKTYQSVKTIQLDPKDEVVRFRIIKEELWVITEKRLYVINGLSIKAVSYTNPQKRPMDVAYLNNKVYLITYPRSTVLEFTGDSFRETGLTKLVNPQYAENYLSLLAKGDTLIIGGDHMCNYLIVKEKTTVKKINLNYNLYSNPAIWDMTVVGHRVFYAIGNTQQEDEGIVTTSINQPIEYFSKRFYTKCLFYDSNTDCLYMGTKYQGVFIQKNCKSTFEIGELNVATTNNKNALIYYNKGLLFKSEARDFTANNSNTIIKAYPKSSLRKIKTIGDTSFILSITGIDYLRGDKIEKFRDFNNDQISGRFFNDCFRDKDIMYFFGYYNLVGLFDIKSKKYSSIGTKNFIPKSEKSGTKIICYNEGKGFKIYENKAEYLIENNGTQLNNIDDFTCSNDTLFVLLNNTLSTYRIEGHNFRFLKTYKIEEIVNGFKAAWVLCSQTAGIYLVSDDAIVKWEDDGQSLQYHYLGNRQLLKKPIFDIDNRLVVNSSGSLTIIPEEQLHAKPPHSGFQVSIPDQLMERSA